VAWQASSNLYAVRQKPMSMLHKSLAQVANAQVNDNGHARNISRVHVNGHEVSKNKISGWQIISGKPSDTRTAVGERDVLLEISFGSGVIYVHVPLVDLWSNLTP
jgi:hypothetical protein